MQKPKVSIVMPVYNREKYVAFAIESILNQSFRNFEFIIVNDGSSDKTSEILSSYIDTRIKIINNDQNKGIVFSRNIGIKNAIGEYISMFDSDDIALPNKLELQIKFLEKKSDFAMVGSWVKMIDENDKLLKTKWKLTASYKKIPAILLFRNYFVQSTVLLRQNCIPKALYTKDFDIVEDYKMWFDISIKYKVANLQNYLVLYRIHSGNISDNNEKHINNEKKLFNYIFKYLDIDISDSELESHYLIKNNKKISNTNQFIEIEKWLIKILSKNKVLKIYNQRVLEKVVFNRWIKVFFKSKSLFFKIIFQFISSPLTYKFL